MDQPDREAEPNFSQPVRQITLMVIVLGLVTFGAYVALPSVLPIFAASPYLNGFIGVVFVIGVLSCFWQVVQLVASVNWIERFVGVRPKKGAMVPPRLLAPLAALLRTRAASAKISPSSARSILDSVATRVDEARDITRYISNLLIFLGLLGTFYGLATTVPAVVETIRALAPSEGTDAAEMFTRLMTGLESQLGGMGTAFASSLLGLAGSLVVGMLELFASHGQNRFFRELEEWLSTITRLSFSGADSDGGELSGAAAVLDHMSQQMEALQSLFTQSDISRSMLDERLGSVAKSMEKMVHRMEGENDTARVLARVAESQERLIDVLQGREVSGGDHLDAESRMRLRSIDVQLLRILEELAAGRQETTAELRAEISGLTRVLRTLSEQGG